MFFDITMIYDECPFKYKTNEHCNYKKVLVNINFQINVEYFELTGILSWDWVSIMMLIFFLKIFDLITLITSFDSRHGNILFKRYFFELIRNNNLV